MSSAYVFIIAGTSLQVYPAIGLIDFLSPQIHKYIVDKNPSNVPSHHNFIIIKNPATQGLEEVIRLLNV